MKIIYLQSETTKNNEKSLSLAEFELASFVYSNYICEDLHNIYTAATRLINMATVIRHREQSPIFSDI